MSTSLVDGASLISDLVLRHPSESVVGVTSMATIIRGLARDQNLGSDVDLGPGSVSSDLNSIRER